MNLRKSGNLYWFDLNSSMTHNTSNGNIKLEIEMLYIKRKLESRIAWQIGVPKSPTRQFSPVKISQFHLPYLQSPLPFNNCVSTHSLSILHIFGSTGICHLSTRKDCSGRAPISPLYTFLVGRLTASY